MNITAKGKFLEDKSGKLQLKDILLDSRLKEFQPVEREIISTGVKNSNLWYYYEFQADLEKKEPILELNSYQLDTVEFHYLIEKKEIDCTKYSLENSNSCYFVKYNYDRAKENDWNNPIRSKNLIFPVPPVAGKSKVKAIFNIQTDGSAVFKVKLMEKQAYRDELDQEIFWNGIFIGFLVLIILYSLFSIITTKEIIYFYYMLFLIP